MGFLRSFKVVTHISHCMLQTFHSIMLTIFDVSIKEKRAYCS